MTVDIPYFEPAVVGNHEQERIFPAEINLIERDRQVEAVSCRRMKTSFWNEDLFLPIETGSVGS